MCAVNHVFASVVSAKFLPLLQVVMGEIRQHHARVRHDPRLASRLVHSLISFAKKTKRSRAVANIDSLPAAVQHQDVLIDKQFHMTHYTEAAPETKPWRGSSLIKYPKTGELSSLRTGWTKRLD